MNDDTNQTKNCPQAIFLMGPTAIGKTDLAIELAEIYPIEIINVDSALVYKGMDIGTGKPSLLERKGIPHHLIDIRDPKQSYSAADFARDALSLMNEIVERQNIPLLVGGTMLYFRALQQGLSLLPSADPMIRAKLLEEANTQGWAAMHQRLTRIDPEAGNRIHPNDPQRIQRALEVYEISGTTMTDFFLEQKRTTSNCKDASQKRTIEEFNIQTFALIPVDRTELHLRIEKRFYKMLENGLVAEVEKLFQRGDLSDELPAVRSVGYRQIWSYLSGKCTYKNMVDYSIAATRQLAKRQLTWLRRYPNIKIIPCLENKPQNNLLGSIESMVHFAAKGSLGEMVPKI
jgi:tRNA dimethylallyltransferase